MMSAISSGLSDIWAELCHSIIPPANELVTARAEFASQISVLLGSEADLEISDHRIEGFVIGSPMTLYEPTVNMDDLFVIGEGRCDRWERTAPDWINNLADIDSARRGAESNFTVISHSVSCVAAAERMQ